MHFLGYDNEEEVMLESLEPSAGPASRKQQLLEASGDASNSSDDMEYETTKSSTKGLPHLQWQPVLPTSVSAGLTTHHNQQHAKPLASSFPGVSSFGIPPPPPPAAWPSPNITAGELDSDSLYSMLMSWYMAGYHTGKITFL